MAAKSPAQQYILLPQQGLRAFATSSDPALSNFLVGLSHSLAEADLSPSYSLGRPGVEMRVLDSIHEDGPKLVEMSSQSASALRAAQPGLRLARVVYYYPAVAARPMPAASPKVQAAAASVKITLKVVSHADGRPVPGATVVAFTDFAQRVGASGKTNSRGEVRLTLGAASKRLERLYVYAHDGYWSALKKRVTVTSGLQVPLIPIDLSYGDGLRYFYGRAPDQAGANVTVGVIDTGIAAHPDLVVDGGLNTVTGEDPADYGDNGAGHGTHVAGIIAARGLPPSGVRGLAPGVRLRSYRVFGKHADGASNFAINKAIDQAVADGCDLINMSLGGGPRDVVTEEAIAHARSQGTLVIVAAGNDGRQPVSFPASDSLSLAVSALGRKGTFPVGTTQLGEVAAPYGTDRKNFIAAFSNVGPEIDFTAPGVGIISTFPSGYAVLDGTSMACPAVTGVAARLLAGRADILGLARDQTRSDAMARVLLQGAQPLGLGLSYEGQGLAR